MSENRITAFSNGTEYMSWLGSNCERCKKEGHCDIERALENASVYDGTIRKSIFDRMGAGDSDYIGMCSEVDWTEEWMAEYLAGQKNDC